MSNLTWKKCIGLLFQPMPKGDEIHFHARFRQSIPVFNVKIVFLKFKRPTHEIDRRNPLSMNKGKIAS